MFNIPSQITQGDRVSWHEELDGYSNSDTLTCFVRGAFSLDLTGVANGKGWDFEILEGTTLVLSPGLYKTQFVIYPARGRKTLGGTDLMVCPSFESITSLDTLDADEKELELINDAIAKVVRDGISEYEIKGRRVTYQDLTALTDRQNYLRNRLSRAKNPNSIGGRNVGIRFLKE